MAIYLGEAGHIELRRREINNVFTSTLDREDVDLTLRRFSFDGIESESLLLTGDRVRFETAKPETGDQPLLVLLADVTDQTGITRYVHVDPLGGIRLYDTFKAAISGEAEGALALVRHTEDQDIEVHLEDVDYRCLAQVTDYSITTNRETLDLTNLGDEFRRNYASGLINGQGECTALWDYEHYGSEDVEYAQYLVQLVIRMKLGAAFDGHFYIKKPNYAGSTLDDCNVYRQGQLDDAIWYEGKCIVTNVAMSFEPSNIIRTRIQFITTEEFQLKSGTVPGFLLQDDSGDYLLNDPDGRIPLDQRI